MNYVQIINEQFFQYLDGYTVTYFDENHNCKPKDLTSEEAINLGVFKLKIVTPPSYDPLTQSLNLADAIFINNDWTQVWSVVELNADQKKQKENELISENKSTAEKLLKDTDWTQVSDVPLLNKQEFVDYRTAVRAIALNPPVQATFPEIPAEQWS
jgi:hypothetical protein